MKNQNLSFEEKISKFDNMPHISKIQAIGILERNREHEDKLKPIYDYFNRSNDSVQDIYWIGDEFQIAKVKTKEGSEDVIRYMAFVDYKTTSSWGRSVAEAMLIAICDKYDGGHSAAVGYIERMLNIRFEEE